MPLSARKRMMRRISLTNPNGHRNLPRPAPPLLQSLGFRVTSSNENQLPFYKAAFRTFSTCSSWLWKVFKLGMRQPISATTKWPVRDTTSLIFQPQRQLITNPGIHGYPYIPWQYPPDRTVNPGLGYCTHSSAIFTTWHRPYLVLIEV